MERKIVIAITGASGSIYPKRLIAKLQTIKNQWSQLSIIITKNAKEVWEIETGGCFQETAGISYYSVTDFSAPFASGSGQYDLMIVIPCSMGTLGRIAIGQSNDLITRAADVILKERRKLICVIRETPYNLIHIRNMETITLCGGIICPATPAFYNTPQTLEEIADTVINRILDLAGFTISSYRWGAKK